MAALIMKGAYLCSCVAAGQTDTGLPAVELWPPASGLTCSCIWRLLLVLAATATPFKEAFLEVWTDEGLLGGLRLETLSLGILSSGERSILQLLLVKWS